MKLQSMHNTNSGGQTEHFRGWILPVITCFVFYCSPGLAVDFPEPGPPKIDREIPAEARQPSFLTLETPYVEWKFHKSADNTHPDGNEQQFMWLMNRARANPTLEGHWLATLDDPFVADSRDFFAVDLQLLQDEFAAYGPKPPAAFDIRLYTAAYEHSLYLITIDDQNHEGQFDRVDNSGFVYITARGNVFSYTQTPVHGHAAFNIDWGYSIDNSGMQDGRGHRMAVMSIDGDYSNVGIAAVPVSDTGKEVGPLVVTGNYCSANTSLPDHHNRFLVGTVWKDRNNNSLYDPGEGAGGITVMPDHGSYYAVTGSSGGYAVPILAAGTYRVTFSGREIPPGSDLTATIGNVSVLLDYTFPEVSQPPSAMPWLHLLLRN
ncbi:MAG: hypothetical protein SCH71_02660 [Desulfobulbaceae bacterium]|nr:hypothetical protein [Desulfobulbaceae bacterium]